MKSLTFTEFFALPAGTIFGQATGLPHQFSTGLFRKGESWPQDYRDEPCISAVDMLADEEGESGRLDLLFAGSRGEDHRFLVYEDDDLDRLAEQIGRGPGYRPVAHDDGETGR